jgi:hypothetical protein
VAQVMLVLDAMRAKEEQLSSQRAVLSTLTGLEDGVQAQLRNLEAENRSLRAELERLDTQNNNLQVGGCGGGRAGTQCGCSALHSQPAACRSTCPRPCSIPHSPTLPATLCRPCHPRITPPPHTHTHPHPQGYSLDYMSNDELRELVDSLTQAVERVRITVQLRRLASKKGGAQPALNLSMDGGSAGGMTREAMRRALEDLQVRVGVCMWCVFCGGCQTGWEGGPGRRRALPGQPGGRFAACGRQALTLSSLPSAPTFGTVQSNGHSRRATAVSEASSGDRYRLDEREL